MNEEFDVMAGQVLSDYAKDNGTGTSDTLVESVSIASFHPSYGGQGPRIEAKWPRS
jgi:hypothetical protein